MLKHLFISYSTDETPIAMTLYEQLEAQQILELANIADDLWAYGWVQRTGAQPLAAAQFETSELLPQLAKVCALLAGVAGVHEQH